MDLSGIQDQVQDALRSPGSLVGTILGGQNQDIYSSENRMGLTFLAMTQLTDNELGSGADNARREGAAALYDEIESTAIQQILQEDPAYRQAYANATPQERRDMMGTRADAIPAADLQARMADVLLGQLDNLDPSAPPTASAVARVQGLMSGGEEAFVGAILANADIVESASASHQLALEEHLALKRSEPWREDNRRPEFQYPLTSIMGALLDVRDPADPDNAEANSAPSRLNEVRIDGVDITPQGQLEARVSGAFDGLADFITHGRNAERHLAQMQNIDIGPRVEGEYRNANVNPLTGPGGLTEGAYVEWIADFTSPQGVQSDYSLVTGGTPGPANIDTVITQAMVGSEIVAFDSVEARQDWNNHLGGLLAGRLVDARSGILQRPDGEQLEQAMLTFASARSDITMATEPDANMDRGLDAEEIRLAQRPIVVAAGVEVAEGVGSELSAVDEAVAARREHRLAETYGVDPVGADGVEAYLAGESGVAVITDPNGSDPNLQTVPVVVALNQQGQTPMPEMGFGVQQTQPAANSPFEAPQPSEYS
ncbi:MAG: hypothetical protein AB8B83_09150 [Bdellovibrionales bacterium]